MRGDVGDDMRKMELHDINFKVVKVIEYDENKPCLICGEPVLSASMGGPSICGSCDCGRCRYCGMTIFVLRSEIDNGASKKDLLEHMKWHHENTPERVARQQAGVKRMNEILDEERIARGQEPLQVKEGKT